MAFHCSPTRGAIRPAAVQSSAKANAEGAEIVGASKAVEKRQTSYEAETKLGGKSRDLSVDSSGKLQPIEEQVTSQVLRDVVQVAVQKRAARRTINKIEAVAVGDSASYDAVVTANGKHSSITVHAARTPHHD